MPNQQEPSFAADCLESALGDARGCEYKQSHSPFSINPLRTCSGRKARSHQALSVATFRRRDWPTINIHWMWPLLISLDMQRPVVVDVIFDVRHAPRAKRDVRVGDGSHHISLEHGHTIAVAFHGYSSGKISSSMRRSSGKTCETMRSPRPYRPERSMRSGESCRTSTVWPCVATIQASRTLIGW
jgi:hypothetical protein